MSKNFQHYAYHLHKLFSVATYVLVSQYPLIIAVPLPVPFWNTVPILYSSGTKAFRIIRILAYKLAMYIVSKLWSLISSFHVSVVCRTTMTRTISSSYFNSFLSIFPLLKYGWYLYWWKLYNYDQFQFEC